MGCSWVLLLWTCDCGTLESSVTRSSYDYSFCETGGLVMFLLTFLVCDTFFWAVLFDVKLTVTFFWTTIVVFKETFYVTFWVLLAVELEVWLTATVRFFCGSCEVVLLAFTYWVAIGVSVAFGFATWITMVVVELLFLMINVWFLSASSATDLSLSTSSL